jgi:sugar (pentulose or hexulose) kinase
VQLIASAAGVALVREDDAATGAAVGAACLGHAACHGALPARRPQPSRMFEPVAAESDRLAPRLARYRHLYPTLAPEFAHAAAA